MFQLFKKKEAQNILLGAPLKGKAVKLQAVNDPTFADGILGEGIAIIPTEGSVYAPTDGTIGLVFTTLHAISMTSPEGVEVLIHVGLDTVKMKGDGFIVHVQAGDTVKKGDLLMTVDLEKIKAAGYDTITPVIICNSDAYEVEVLSEGTEVEAKEEVLKVSPKK